MVTQPSVRQLNHPSLVDISYPTSFHTNRRKRRTNPRQHPALPAAAPQPPSPSQLYSIAIPSLAPASVVAPIASAPLQGLRHSAFGLGLEWRDRNLCLGRL